MRRPFTGLTLLLLAGASLGARGQASDAPPGPPPNVVVVPIVGVINAQSQAFLLRAVREIRVLKPDLVVFEIDTPGGAGVNMIRMGEEIMRLDPIPTVAFVRPPADGDLMMGGAISAGVYLSISCKKLYMYPGTVIGASAPIIPGPGGATPVGEKGLSMFRNKFRARADQNGYPANLIEAMVDLEVEVHEVKVDGETRYLTMGEIDELRAQAGTFDVAPAPFIAKDKLLTMTDTQVAATGMGRVIKDRGEIYEEFGIAAPVEHVMQRSWSEGLVGFLTSGIVSFLLLVLGVLGVWVELKSPGFGAAGAVGIVSFGLLLFGQHLIGLAEFVEIVLIVVGVVLLAVEIFAFPGMGIFAVSGVICIFAGLILSFQDFVLPSPTEAPWEMEMFIDSIGRVVLGCAAATIAFLGVMRYLPKVPIANRLVLQAEISGTAPTVPGDTADLVARHGHAVTPLRPSGKISIDGEIHDVLAEGDFVATGEPVEVLRVEGAQVIVGKIKR